jgi:hypothetical protein
MARATRALSAPQGNTHPPYRNMEGIWSNQAQLLLSARERRIAVDVRPDAGRGDPKEHAKEPKQETTSPIDHS